MSATLRRRHPVALSMSLFATLSLALLMAVSTAVLTAPSADAATRVRHAISVARNQIGDPYHYGSDGPAASTARG